MLRKGIAELMRIGLKPRFETPMRVENVIGLNVLYNIYEVLRLAYQNLRERMCYV